MHACSLGAGWFGVVGMEEPHSPDLQRTRLPAITEDLIPGLLATRVQRRGRRTVNGRGENCRAGCTPNCRCGQGTHGHTTARSICTARAGAGAVRCGGVEPSTPMDARCAPAVLVSPGAVARLAPLLAQVPAHRQVACGGRRAGARDTTRHVRFVLLSTRWSGGRALPPWILAVVKRDQTNKYVVVILYFSYLLLNLNALIEFGFICHQLFKSF